MATKRDQLQSYQFLVQRVVSALVTRETDPEQAPFRRATSAAFGSIAIAILVIAGFTVYGFLVPGGKNSWRDGASIIVEKETGTRFVYVDGRLRPVTNYASALLAVGKYAPIRMVSQNSLTDVRRGPRIGIPDAPDALPPANRLLQGSWSMCSQPETDLTGAPVEESVLMVGQDAPGGHTVEDDALLVAVSRTRDRYLLWRGHRHLIRPADIVTVGVALHSEPWATVGAELVDALPVGESMAPIRLSGIGERSTAVTSSTTLRVGQLLVLETSGGGTQYYLAERDRLRPISALQYDIQRSYPPTATAYDGQRPVALTLDPITAGQAQQDPTVSAAPGRLPSVRPSFVGPRDVGAALCAKFEPGTTTPVLSVDAQLPSRDEQAMTPTATVLGAPLADRVLVPPGSAVVVETMPAQNAPVGTVGLVTDLGIAYPLAGPEVLGMLGYGGVRPVRMPASLVARIPIGSGLDPKAAMRQPANPSAR